MKNSNLLLPLLIILITLQSQINQSNSQQPYLNNNQLDCNKNFSNTNGFQCNGNTSSCTAYLTFRSQPPYTTPPNIAFLLNSSASTIARLNNVSEVNPVPTTRLLIIPVSCSCTTPKTRNSTRYYQHNAEYRLQNTGEAYFTVANNTYQGLTTCQAMINQNPYNITGLNPGDQLLVPIMCACPTTQQKTQYNSQYLLSYLVTWGDTISIIADMFGADHQSVLDANQLKADDVIYPFTPILVPLKTVPTHINLPSPPPAPPPQTPPPPPGTSPGSGGGSSSNKGVIIGVATGVGIFVIVIVSFLLWFFLVRQTRKNPITTTYTSKEKDDKLSESPFYTTTPTTVSYSTSQMSTKSSSVDLNGLKLAIGSLTVYKFNQIEEATGKFSEGNRIKGSVYRGKFKGDEAAIKILKGNVSNDEINILNHINHSNIVRLSGYCIHEGNTYLVFEYAEKGSLDDWLFQQQDSLFPTVLTWKQRVQIACNIADALNYLHSYIQPPYIHKNLKTSNVLLDRNLRAKITNFGLARTIQDQTESGVLHLTKHVVGTHGYLAPEYIENGAVTTKLDVFAFGVVILELLSGQPAVTTNSKGGDDLLCKVIRKMFEGEDVREKIREFMDSNLGSEYPMDLAYSMAQLGYKCVDPDVNSRPSMSEISMTLSKIYSTSLDWDPSDEIASSSSFSYGR